MVGSNQPVQCNFIVQIKFVFSDEIYYRCSPDLAVGFAGWQLQNLLDVAGDHLLRSVLPGGQRLLGRGDLEQRLRDIVYKIIEQVIAQRWD